MERKPSIRSIQRARNNPDKVTATTLYALSDIEKCSMEELLDVPLTLAGTKINGYCVDDDGVAHCFTTDLPDTPRQTAYYVYRDGFDRYRVNRYRNIVDACEIIGIVVATLIPTGDTPDPGTYRCWAY